MKYLLLLAIRFYWLVPKSKRRACLFKHSCSHYVFDIAAERGLIAGIRALRYRYAVCRGGFQLYINPFSGKAQVILVNNDIISGNEIADRLLINCHICD